MFDFRVFRGRTVRVRLTDGTRYLGRFQAVLSTIEPGPSVWINGWFGEHVLGLGDVAEMECTTASAARLVAA